MLGDAGISDGLAWIVDVLNRGKWTALAVFLCSASPVHRSAARKLCNEHGWSRAFRPPHMDPEMFPDGNPLVVALRM